MRGRRPQPPDDLDRRGDPVQAGQERPARGDAPGRRRRSTAAASSRSPARGGSTPARSRAAAAERGRRVFRDPLGGPARPDRHQRDELAAVRRSGPRAGGGAVRRRAAGRRRAAIEQLTADGWTALHDLVADAPERCRAGPVRALADRAVQRVAGGVPRGRPGRPAGRRTGPDRSRTARLTDRLWHTSARRRSAQEGPWERPGCRPTRRNTAPAWPTRSDAQIDAWAAELMRDVAIRRGVVKVVEDFRRRPASTRPVSNGCSLPAAGRRPSSGATATGPPDGPGDHALRPRPGHPTPRSPMAATG